MPHIDLEDLSFSYSRGATVFASLTDSFSTSEGKIVGVMGPSGSGKSTLLGILAGIFAPTRGRVRHRPPTAVSSYLPQECILFEHLTREKNARYFESITRLRDRFSEKAFQTVSQRLRLPDILRASGSVIDLSGGEKQRLALLRALSIEPEVLLLDEPCNGLDSLVKYDFLRTLRIITNELHLLVFYVTHHPEEIRLIADDVLYLERVSDVDAAASYHMELRTFLERPPTLQAARLFSDPFLTVLQCTVENQTLRLMDGRKIAKVDAVNGLNQGTYLMGCPKEAIRCDDAGALEVTSVGDSSEFWLVRITSFEDSPIILIPRLGPPPHRLQLCGDVFAFDSRGQGGHRVTLSPAVPQ